LPIRSILAARLVCKHWHQSIGCLISQLTLPFEAWSGSNTNSNTAAPQQQQRSALLFQAQPRSPTADAESADEKEEGDEAAAAEDAGDAVWMPPAGILPMRSSKRQRRTPAKVQQQQQQQDDSALPAQRHGKKQKREQGADEAGEAGSSAAAAAAEKEAAPVAELHDSQQDHEQQQQQQRESTVQDLLPAGHQQHMETEQELRMESPAQLQLGLQELRSSPAGAGTAAATAAAAVSPSPAAAVAASPAQVRASQQQQQQQASFARQHPLQHLPASCPYVTKVTLQCRSRSSSASERALPAADVLAASLQLLGELPKLQTVLLQGSLPRPMWQPLLAGLQQQQGLQDGDAAQQQAQISGAEPALQQQQVHGLPLGIRSSSSGSSLQQKLVCLQLVGCDLPPAVVLEGLLGCLGGLRELLLHASIKSPALQVRPLMLLLSCVYTAWQPWLYLPN
jgi:hypothetical protein